MTAITVCTNITGVRAHDVYACDRNGRLIRSRLGPLKNSAYGGGAYNEAATRSHDVMHTAKQQLAAMTSALLAAASSGAIKQCYAVSLLTHALAAAMTSHAVSLQSREAGMQCPVHMDSSSI